MTRDRLFLILAIALLVLVGPAWAQDEATGTDVGDSNVMVVDLQQVEPVTDVPISPQASGFDPLNYTLGPEDVIEIQVLRHPEFSGTYPVNLEGKIQYKFVGDIDVTGMTKKDLEEKVASLISKYVIEPKVSVTILEYKSKVIYVLGEVARPGKYYMKSETISVREAVVAAGLPTYAAAMRKCQLITPSNGNVDIQDVNIFNILYEGDLTNNINMKPNDVFYVPATVMAKLIRIINPVVAPITSTASGVNAAANMGD